VGRGRGAGEGSSRFSPPQGVGAQKPHTCGGFRLAERAEGEGKGRESQPGHTWGHPALGPSSPCLLRLGLACYPPGALRSGAGWGGGHARTRTRTRRRSRERGALAAIGEAEESSKQPRGRIRTRSLRISVYSSADSTAESEGVALCREVSPVPSQNTALTSRTDTAGPLLALLGTAGSKLWGKAASESGLCRTHYTCIILW